MALALVTALGLNFATEGRLKAFYKQAFQYYLSPTVIDRLLDNPSRLQLGGKRRELSIFFSDLQGFSSISERLDPHDLTSLLNEYLTDMTDIILEEDGPLDKYEGNMGSRQRFDCTVLGDAANLASRLEEAKKAFDTYNMVAESTWLQTKGAIPGREMGLLRVVGRKTPVRVFQPLTPDTPMAVEHLQAFNQALASCQQGRWTEALDVFSVLDKDPLSAVYAKRCRELMDMLKASWDGIWNLTEK